MQYEYIAGYHCTPCWSAVMGELRGISVGSVFVEYKDEEYESYKFYNPCQSQINKDVFAMIKEQINKLPQHLR